MPSAFCTWVRAVMKSKGITQDALGQALGTTSANISKILSGFRGRNPPPPESVERWAEALGIPPGERSRFRDLAAIAYLPDQAQPRFLTLLDEVPTLRQRVSHLEARLAAGGADVPIPDPPPEPPASFPRLLPIPDAAPVAGYRPWIIYLRANPDARRSGNLEQQREACLGYARANGYLVQHLLDDAASVIGPRPAYDQMCGLIATRGIAGVLVHDLARIERSVNRLVRFLHFLEAADTLLVSVSDRNHLRAAGITRFQAARARGRPAAVLPVPLPPARPAAAPAVPPSTTESP